MPLTRQNMRRKRLMRQRRLNEGVVYKHRFLAGYERLNCTKRTGRSCRRKMKQFDEELPEDKTVRYGTLQKWQTSLLQKGYTPGSVNAVLSMANVYLGYT